MKQFLKQYLMTWLKFFVVIPGLVFIYISSIITSVYTLFSAALLGDGKSYNEIQNDMIDRLESL